MKLFRNPEIRLGLLWHGFLLFSSICLWLLFPDRAGAILAGFSFLYILSLSAVVSLNISRTDTAAFRSLAMKLTVCCTARRRSILKNIRKGNCPFWKMNCPK